MDAQDVEHCLDSALPDEQVIEDLRAILRSEAKAGSVRIELDGQWVLVPLDAEIALVTKAFFKTYQAEPFGAYRVQVAVGGVKSHRHGILEAWHCFAMLYYNAQGQRFTVDFYRDMR
jgi:hypothetical protein